MYVTMQHTQPIRLQFPLFLNKSVILTILFLQCGCCSYQGLFDCCTVEHISGIGWLRHKPLQNTCYCTSTKNNK